jgi:SAM-dependent methyltransferase
MTHGPDPHGAELGQVVARYARRATGPDPYSLLRPEVWQMLHERHRALYQGLAQRAWLPEALRITEVGCGAGGNLQDWLRLGCQPGHLTGCELLPERLAQARASLPTAVRLTGGDATTLDIAPDSQDLVMQATVFSSLLDDAVQQRLAQAMWRWVKPGGVVLWYDFAFNNPRNRDVRGVPVARVKALFAQAAAWQVQRITLAPPLARRVCAWHPSLYGLFNALPLLRTHRLIWITKGGRLVDGRVD